MWFDAGFNTVAVIEKPFANIQSGRRRGKSGRGLAEIRPGVVEEVEVNGKIDDSKIEMTRSPRDNYEESDLDEN